LELGISARRGKSFYDGLPDGRTSFKMGLVLLIQYRLWQTDGRKDRQTDTLP